VAVPLPIETDRLLVRRFRPQLDTAAMGAVYGDPDVMRRRHNASERIGMSRIETIEAYGRPHVLFAATREP
jgi:hypothetical protein